MKIAAGNAVGDIKAAAGSAVKDVNSATMHQVEDVREKAGESDHTPASRFGNLAGRVEQDLTWLSGAVTKSADGLDNMTDPLTRGDPGQTFNPIADFARRQPAILLVALLGSLAALRGLARDKLQGVADEAMKAGASFTERGAAKVEKRRRPSSTRTTTRGRLSKARASAAARRRCRRAASLNICISAIDPSQG